MVMISDNFKTMLRIVGVFFIIILTDIHSDDRLPTLPSKVENQRKTIDIFAKALYWYTSETLDWAFTLKSDQNFVQTSYKTFSFDWSPGFSVGFRYNMEHDKWDTQASYTRFQSKATDHASGSVTPAFLAARLSLLEPFSTGKARLNLHYNIFDWDLGRNFLVGKQFFLRPSIGLRGGWINQNIYSDWTIPHFLDLFLFSASENLKQRFHGVGPKGGISGKYRIGNIQRHSFNFIGQFELGYLWGHWSIKDKYIDNLSTVIYVKTLDRNFGSLVLHSFMGFEWDCKTEQDRYYFRLKFGYEIEDWLNHCQIFSDASGSQNNDLILQGLNFGLHFDF
ncbi:MAG: hypothetical protein K1060chlam5_01176 [Candidatus Anoxychlamydiales bacterium]|nr:hypothetical protein [Candidatus Anoxychlamydiales bacterium]